VFKSRPASDDRPIIGCRTAFANTLGRQETLQYAPFRFAQVASAQERLLFKEDF
jgi:hypothetical protein